MLLVFPLAGCGRPDVKEVSGQSQVASPQVQRQRPNHPPRPIDEGDRYTERSKAETPVATERERGPASIGALSISAFSPEGPSENSGLLIGSPVPPLADLQVVKSDKTASGPDGRLLIVHFWEPWNLLSRQSVLLLSGLQQEFSDRVRVLHIAAAKAEAINEFLDEAVPSTGKPRKEQLAGTFLADTQRQMVRMWKVPSGESCLPVVYLADAAGILQWSGPGLRIERPLRAVLGGTWNLESAALAAETLEQIEHGIQLDSMRGLPAKARQLFQETPDDPDAAIILLDLLLASEKYGELEQVAQQAVASCGNNVEALNSLAWMLVAASESPRVPLETALLAASRAVQLSGRRSDTLETLARVHFRRRSFREAVVIQREAVAGAAEDNKRLLEAILREYEQAGR
ncbi:MAG: hypothetical protein ACKO2P_21065 [Planctomycetota bacterium]